MSAHLLRGLAANPALPDELLDRLIGRLADGPLARASSQRGAAPATGPEEDEDEDEIGEPLIRALAAGRGRDRGRSGTQPAGAPSTSSRTWPR
ncbi:hypothetical protein OG311_05380 [Streptomyces sp. NBC_01343]|uniref:hypothetical protein n=1 Tax=Streptomyces sp. NBC_01343 TaxID=2903832 RepID=UPI002E0E959F|nr:hypothetical protein OG311_05380 [Streptomyces sp. NBC_01343]